MLEWRVLKAINGTDHEESIVSTQLDHRIKLW